MISLKIASVVFGIFSFVTIFFVFHQVSEYSDFINHSYSTEAEITSQSKQSTHLLFKDYKDQFHELSIDKLPTNAKKTISIYYKEHPSQNEITVLLAATKLTWLWFVFLAIMAITFMYAAIMFGMRSYYINKGYRKGLRYHTLCHDCQHYIYYNCYQSFANLYPHFYCNSCSNVIWRKSDRDKINKNTLSRQLLIAINTQMRMWRTLSS